MAATLREVLFGNTLSPASRKQLKIWMFENTTGDDKSRAGLDPSRVLGDKTGNGANGASNDVAVVFPRGMPPFVIAVFYSGSTAPKEAKSAVIAELAKISSAMLLSRQQHDGNNHGPAARHAAH